MMARRYLCLWFPFLLTDSFIAKRPVLNGTAFVLALPDHGRLKITAASTVAMQHGIHPGMAVADARAMVPSLEVFDDHPNIASRLLKSIARWCIRFTPEVAIDPTDGLFLNISGCAHLWGGEQAYLHEIVKRLKVLGYNARGAIADTAGTAWAVARYSKTSFIVSSGEQSTALHPLPVACLRLEQPLIDRLQKLGLFHAGDFMHMPRNALRRRFGQSLLDRLDEALGTKQIFIECIVSPEPYQLRLPCIEPVRTATAIEIAIERLLKEICERLHKENKGLRSAALHCYRVDGVMKTIQISTSHPSANPAHLFKLFETKINTIDPGLGIELFLLEAMKVEEASTWQQKFWDSGGGLQDIKLAELLDRIADRTGEPSIRRYLPDEHHWPERSVKIAKALTETPTTEWRTDRPRPIRMLAKPEPIEVTAPVPDYPPMLFRYKGKLHSVKKADGPERIEREWWIQEGLHRDYYCVEDEEGCRYWLFRSGHYQTEKKPAWYIHGFFA